jgi:N-acetylglutamate synthase-like GNAT family acetyltransferase
MENNQATSITQPASNKQPLSLRYEPIGNPLSRQVIDLILPIQQLEFKVATTLEAQADLLDIERYYTQPGGGFWGALDDQQQVVGTIALVLFQKDAGAIRKMFVKKEYRGKELGVARQLLEVLISYSRQAGIKELYLGTVDVMKAAQRFYEKSGFTQIDKLHLPPTFPLMSVDNIFYHLSLK